MREIKFRAWTQGQMQYDWFTVGIDNDDGLLVSLPLYKKAEVVMQYTGLKDKNGKEIYEGDVVRGTTDEWDAETKTDDIVEVEWDSKTCGFLPFSGYDSDCGTGTSPRHVEVIGNIYENPELLNNNKK